MLGTKLERWVSCRHSPVDSSGILVLQVVGRLAERVNCQEAELSLYLDCESEEPLGREQTVGLLGLTILSVLQARARVAGAPASDAIQIKLQTKDRRAKVAMKTLHIEILCCSGGGAGGETDGQDGDGDGAVQQ